MIRTTAALIVFLIFCSWGCSHADNPRISLKVENATCQEAITLLSKAVNQPMVLGVPGMVGLDERASFDWSNATLADALRQICARYRLTVNPRSLPGYMFYPAPAAGMPAPPPAGLVQKNGLRLFAASVQLSDHRSVSFQDGSPDWHSASLTLQIGCQIPGGDAETIAGFTRLSARDDRGTVLAVRGNPEQLTGGRPGRFPDEWFGHVSLDPPHPKARKLDWVEGDLVIFKRVRPVRVEIAFPALGKTARTEVGGISAVVSAFPQFEDDPEEPAPGPGVRPGSERRYWVRTRLQIPVEDETVRSLAHAYMSPMPVAIGDDGELLQPAEQMAFSSRSDNTTTVIGGMFAFATPRPPKRLVWMMAQRTEPQRLLTFRMTNIPLPGQAVAAANRMVLPPPPPRPRPPNADRAYFHEGGGVVVSRVEPGGQPAAGGVLALGLSRKEPKGWSATRWISVDVEPDGTARLEDLQPGTYRIARTYRPSTDGTVLKGPWSNAQVTVTVQAGKEVSLPPLVKTTERPAGR